MQSHSIFKRAAASSLVLFTYVSFNATATVHYVNLNNPAPVSPYTSWATAATNIQDAVDAAIASDEIVVTNGVYQTGGRRLSNGTLISNRVAVTKPLLLRSVNGPAFTVIRGSQSPLNPPIVVGMRCIYLTNGAVLSGFTLTNGATWDSGGAGDSAGGGVWCEDTFAGAFPSAVVSNCVLTGNAAYSDGAGAWKGTLENCTITGNWSYGAGGGADRSTLNNCLVSSNSARVYGGGVFGGALTNCTLTTNWSYGDGGGAYGGTLNNCVVSGNSASNGGGGVFESTLINCILADNRATNGYGGGAYLGSGTSRLTNCTLVNNSAMQGGGVYGGPLFNCIAYYNHATLGSNYLNSTLNYCCMAPMPNHGFGNITNEPAFVDFAGGNLRLQSNSPCINSGNNAYAPVAFDLDGNPRITGGTVDIGAYEYQSPTSIISYAWLQQYGLPIDGSADHADPDGDGFDNWQESRAGTSPFDATSLLRMTSIVVDTNGATATWQSVPGIVYVLECSSNLTALPPFTTVSSNIVGQTNTTSFTDPTVIDSNTGAIANGPFFYRVGVQ
jgi:hypothetical protein